MNNVNQANGVRQISRTLETLWAGDKLPAITVAAHYTVLPTNHVVVATHGATAINVTLPTTGVGLGKTFIIKRGGVAAVTVKGVIDGATDFVLVTNKDAITVQHIGAGNYIIISSHIKQVIT